MTFSSSTSRNAIVIGAGIAGLAAGHALRRAGYDVRIYERTPVLEPRGAALSLWPNAKEALRRIGMLDAIAAAGAEIESLSILLASGEPLTEVISLPNPGMIVPRTDLQSRLAEPLADILQLDCDVIDVVGDPSAPRVAMGTREEPVDLVINAAGIHSQVADRLLDNPPYFRKAGGVVAIADVAVAAPACGTEFLGTDERAGLMPLPGDRSYWWFMRNQTDPRQTISLAEIEQRTRNWPDALRSSVSSTRSENAHQVAVFARTKPTRLGSGRVICVGDAAHGMDPNQGQGACQALEDAAVLGDLAARLEPGDILPAFERARLSRVKDVMGRSAFWSHAAHGSLIGQKLVRSLVRLTPPAWLARSMRSVHHMPAQ